MLASAQGWLSQRGIEDELLAVGQFNPRGHSGGMFAGGLAGGDAGGLAGGVGESVGVGLGAAAGARAADATSGLPSSMLVGVSENAVYGLAAAHRNSEPSALVFQVERAGLTVKVHQRVNVRILELIDEGFRVPHRAGGQPHPAHSLEGRDPGTGGLRRAS